ncbi:MAG: helicase-exonuclease AddAB subunit AddB [Firmicutes bacterium]|nr:helicase-exonuclease AddAB subunit AddB [Bacillota bacterium]
MSLRFIMGRAGTGKTTLCLNEVRSALREDPCGPPIILLVPEQATFQVEHALVNTPDLPGFMRAQVLSFKRLAGRLLQELGGGARRDIGELGKLMVLRSLVLQKSGELSIFVKGSEKYGFAECLAETLRELTMYRVGPEDLEARVADLERAGFGTTALALKLRDLALIARAYRGYLGDRFQDPDDHLSLAATKIARSTLTKGALIWVDGFRGFTPQEYSVLEALFSAASRVSVALCLDPNALGRPLQDTELFRPTRETYDNLTALARKLGMEIEPPVILPAAGPWALGGATGTRTGVGTRTSTGTSSTTSTWTGTGTGAGIGTRSAPLSHLEREFGSRRPSPFGEEPHGVRLVAAANPRAEVEAAAREILRLAREEGMRFRDIGVIVADLETYHDLIQPIFKDHGIPFFIDRRRSVGHHPLIELVRSALDVVCEDWAYDPVFRYLKTDLVPVSRREVDLLENFVLARGIRGRRWLDSDPWKYRRAFGLEDVAEDAALRPEDEEMTRAIAEARSKATSALGAFYRKVVGDAGGGAVEGRVKGTVRGTKPVRDMARALFELLADLHVRKRVEEWAQEAMGSGDIEAAREHQQVWNAVIGLLDEVVEALGNETTDASGFREVIEAGLQGMTLGLIPPALDQVIVGSVERSRHPGLRAAFVLGATYDAFPRRVLEETIFSDYEREMLEERGLVLAPTSRVAQFHEQYNVYVALTRAREYLWVSYPMADGEGRALRPSPVRAQLKAVFPKLVEEFAGDEASFSPEEALDAITSEARAAAMLVRHFRASATSPSSGGAEGQDIFWLNLYEWLVEDPERRLRASRVLKSLAFTSQVERLQEATVRALYPNPIRTSVSRLENFARCPFAHFAGNTLGLAERELFRLEPPGMGTFIHEALRKLIDDLGDERTLASMTDDDIAASVTRIVDELAPRLQNEILRSSARYRYIERVLTRILKRSATVLKEHANRSEFRSVRREVAFGRGYGGGDSLPGLELEIDGGRHLSLVGRIDRVDMAKAGDISYLRVIDYKSSRRSLNLSDVYYGLALQLLVYLAVAEVHSDKLAGASAKPAGALYFPATDPVVSLPGPVDDKALENRRKRLLKMTGIIVGDAGVVKLMDTKVQGASDIVPARLTKDGEVAKSSGNSVIDHGRYSVLRKFLLGKIRELSSRIVAGEVAPRPYRRGKFRACQWCSFKPVCGFDILLPGNEYRTITNLKNDEFWAAVEKDLSGGSVS